jgi:hypothetical protein
LFASVRFDGNTGGTAALAELAGIAALTGQVFKVGAEVGFFVAAFRGYRRIEVWAPVFDGWVGYALGDCPLVLSERNSGGVMSGIKGRFKRRE